MRTIPYPEIVYTFPQAFVNSEYCTYISLPFCAKKQEPQAAILAFSIYGMFTVEAFLQGCSSHDFIANLKLLDLGIRVLDAVQNQLGRLFTTGMVVKMNGRQLGIHNS